MDLELRLMRNIGKSLPNIPHITAMVNKILRPIYLRKKRSSVEADVFGFKMELDPEEIVDSGLLFYPQLYDRHEICYMKEHLEPGDVFFDIGANIGIYSLIASKLVDNEGKVLAIEADPFNFKKLNDNILLNCIGNILPINVGVSDKKETLKLGICSGNRGGNSFLQDYKEFIEVECCPLMELSEINNIRKIKGMKIDIEGFEFRVLRHFFANAATELHPDFIIIEHFPDMIRQAGGDSMQLLIENGYRQFLKNKFNHIMIK